MLYFEVTDATTHIPDDVVFLPVISEGFSEFIIRLVHDMQWSVVGSFKTSLIERNQRVSAFEEIVSIFCFWWLVVDLPELAVSLLVSEFVYVTSERENGITIFVEELRGEIEMCGICPVVHDICEEEEGVVFFSYSPYLSTDFLDPFIEDLLEIIGGYLCADDVTTFDSIFDCLDEFLFVSFNPKRDKVCPNIR